MNRVEPLLFLVHRIPFPPNKGDKIRSFNLLKHLSQRFRIHLGSFVDDPHDWHYREDLKHYCESLYLRPLHPRRARLKSLTGLLTGQPLTIPYYRDAAMTRWVRDMLDQGVDRVLVFSAAMAQYLPPDPTGQRHTVIDFVDVDSDKWCQYASGHRFPMNRVYRREARTLLNYERRLAALADASVFVTDDEAALFRTLAPESAGRVHAIDNGVDTGYFSPEREYPNPYTTGGVNLVFTGAMDYWANIDAVCWFAESIFPRILETMPDARFVIVGARPAPAVRQLADCPGVTVTGAVPDIRPYLAHADGAVAPLRIARGVQNKVLEALAMARPVVATPQALEGLRRDASMQWLVGTEPPELAVLCQRMMQDPGMTDWGKRGREFVCRHYSWSEHVDCLIRLLETAPQPMAEVTGRLESRA